MKSQALWAPLEQTQTPSAKGLREGREGSDRIKSSDPFLQAVASAEETLEDRDTKIWAHSSGMEDVWRYSQHSLLPAPSPPTHSPILIELFVSPPVIVAGSTEQFTPRCFPGKTLSAFPPASAPKFKKVQLKNCRKTEKRRKGRFSRAITHKRWSSFSRGGVKQWKLYLIEVHKGISWHNFEITPHENAGVTGRAAKLKHEFDSNFVWVCRF